jgi:hypothetical protein
LDANYANLIQSLQRELEEAHAEINKLRGIPDYDRELVTPDEDEPLPVGDLTLKKPTAQQLKAARDASFDASQAKSEGNLYEAVRLFTTAILNHPRSAKLYIFRAQVRFTQSVSYICIDIVGDEEAKCSHKRLQYCN